jgi:DNA polymerase IV
MALRYLFIDMNSYFASVEQQLQPRLRGKPVAVIPVNADTTSCIAASYEAKKFGVKTGTRVSEARVLCPGIIFVPVRSDINVRTHHEIIAAIDSCIPVDKVMSIDEMICRLERKESSPEAAIQLAASVKESIRRRCGEWLKSSIGIAPNRLLAKVAADMQKPDGMTIIQSEELPQRLFGLKLKDFPGIGPRMEKRLWAAGIGSVERLCSLSPADLARIWGGRYTGACWWHRLRGEDVPDPPTRHRSLGHSKVLAPKDRNDVAAHAIIVRLLHKAAARLRHEKHWANSLTLDVSYLGRRPWASRQRIEPCQDTLTLLRTLGPLWEHKPVGKMLKIGVVLGDLESQNNVTRSLFERDHHLNDLATALDGVNQKFGRHTLYFSGMHGQIGDYHSAARIAFNRVPDLALVDP